MLCRRYRVLFVRYVQRDLCRSGNGCLSSSECQVEPRGAFSPSSPTRPHPVLPMPPQSVSHCSSGNAPASPISLPKWTNSSIPLLGLSLFSSYQICARSSVAPLEPRGGCRRRRRRWRRNPHWRRRCIHLLNLDLLTAPKRLSCLSRCSTRFGANFAQPHRPRTNH